MKWFRVHNEIIHNPKLLMLSPADRWYFIGLLALKRSGTLDKYEPDKLVRVIRQQLRLDPDEWTECFRRLVDENLITTELQIPGWDKYQYVSDSSTARVQKHRNKLKHACNVSVTPPDTDTDTDTDKKNTSLGKPKDTVPAKKIVELYNEILPELPECKLLTEARRAAIRQRWTSGDLPALDNWRNYFEYVKQSPFLTGKVDGYNGKRPFKANLEWLCKAGNFAKVLEENYHGV